jgi:hypothetical protein
MALGTTSPFRPAGTVGLTVGSVPVNIAIEGSGESIVVTNTTNGLIYVRFGSDASVMATTADMPVLPASRVILSVNRLITHAAAFSPTSSGLVLFSIGDGSTV